MASVAPTVATDAIFGSWIWREHWTDRTISYSFPVDVEDYPYTSRTPVSPLRPAQAEAVERVLADVASFTGLTFERVSDQADDFATLRFSQDTGETGAYAYLPQEGEEGGDSFYGRQTRAPVLGNEAYLYFLHEIGHTLGLQHGHEATGFKRSPYNSQEFSVMTYADFVGDRNLSDYESGRVDWAQSYQQLDIAALQYLYGANYNTTGEVWSGRTVYAFDPTTGEMSINGEGLGAPAGNRIFRTIWDGDGVDTYDLSAYENGVSVDLRPGAWSVFSEAQLADLNRFNAIPEMMARGNLANARLVEGDRRALIENAIGGSGDDSLTGNVVCNRMFGGEGDDTLQGAGGGDRLVGGAGSDILLGGRGNDNLRGGVGADLLQGGAGNDVLTGGAGKDCFVFARADGNGVSCVTDFAQGADVLEIRSGRGVTLALQLEAGFAEDGASVATEADGDGTRVLVDFNGDRVADLEIRVLHVAALTADDFLV
ncbi:MAG: M10 family metallopeptidase [Pseudooceanicola sp.]|nr:M10 family metallopeptidase [Pseudooceanicola sp.]